MASTVGSLTVSAAVAWDLTNVLDLATAHDKGTLSYTDSLTDGTSAAQIKAIWHDKGTIASGGSATIDVAGSLADAFGNTAVFTKIKGLMIINHGVASGSTFTETSGENITLSSSTLLIADSEHIIEPGGVYLATSPIVGGAVTATSADTITLGRAGSATVTYSVIIWGLL